MVQAYSANSVNASTRFYAYVNGVMAGYTGAAQGGEGLNTSFIVPPGAQWWLGTDTGGFSPYCSVLQ